MVRVVCVWSAAAQCLRSVGMGLGVLVWLVAGTSVHAEQWPSFEAWRASQHSSDAKLLDRRGQTIATKRIDFARRRGDWVALDDVSPALVQGVLLAEDQRFPEHSGVDWQAAAGSLWRQMQGHDKRGASTITMQMVALLQPELARQKGGRTVAQKWAQMQAARELELRWSKEQILEAYLNGVSFRGELQGVGAASRGLFGKAPSGLDKLESAVLSALIRSPNASPSQIASRACALYKNWTELPCNAALVRDGLRGGMGQADAEAMLAPHAATRLLGTKTPVYRSSLDAQIQRMAMQSLREQLLDLRAGNANDGAVVVLDNLTGQVVAYVGSSAELSAAPEVDAVQALRQAGSTLKPLLYARAMDKELLGAATVLDDSPVSIATGAGLYTPQNYDQQFIGPVSVRKALASSLNIPALRVIGLVGVDDFYRTLKSLGFQSLAMEADHYGQALALGAADVRLLELANAYRTLANGGVHSPVVWGANEAAVQGGRIYSARTAWLIGNILSDNAARSHTFGFDSVLATPMWTAVKTGTSKDMRDNWCVGYSREYTVGVWVGNAGGQAMHQVSGVSGAAPVWAQVMRELHKTRGSAEPHAPAGLQVQRIAFESGFEPGRLEWTFTERKAMQPASLEVALSVPATQARIVYPIEGSLIAWDPDIPQHMQGLTPLHNGEAGSLNWILNGVRMVVDPGRVLRLPLSAGKNRLELRDEQDQPVDQVVFEVRGMPASRIGP